MGVNVCRWNHNPMPNRNMYRTKGWPTCVADIRADEAFSYYFDMATNSSFILLFIIQRKEKKTI